MVDIGCVDFMTAHMPGDVLMGPHGRTGVLASGYKRMQPDRLVCAIQGDGGFMGLGAAESLHTAVRGEQITIIVLNNGVLADTGGQLAATTLGRQGHQHDSRRSRSAARSAAAVPGDAGDPQWGCLCRTGGDRFGARRAPRATGDRQGVRGAAVRRGVVDRRGAQPVPHPLADGLGAGVGVHQRSRCAPCTRPACWPIEGVRSKNEPGAVDRADGPRRSRGSSSAPSCWRGRRRPMGTTPSSTACTGR